MDSSKRSTSWEVEDVNDAGEVFKLVVRLFSVQRFYVITSKGLVFEVIHLFACHIICQSVWLASYFMEDRGQNLHVYGAVSVEQDSDAVLKLTAALQHYQWKDEGSYCNQKYLWRNL